MAFLTESEARQRAGRITKRLRQSAVEALTESIFVDETFDVFLSHSSNEHESILLGVEGYLEDQGLSVYVDKYNDHDLSPQDATLETANRLRKRLMNSDALIFAYSQHSALSRWMPWELGFMDGKSGKIGVLPVVQTAGLTYDREEYLSLYPYVDKAKAQNTKMEYFWIRESPRRYARLDRWIKGDMEISDH